AAFGVGRGFGWGLEGFLEGGLDQLDRWGTTLCLGSRNWRGRSTNLIAPSPALTVPTSGRVCGVALSNSARSVGSMAVPPAGKMLRYPGFSLATRRTAASVLPPGAIPRMSQS